jgi:GcrA cell cycle regulator
LVSELYLRRFLAQSVALCIPHQTRGEQNVTAWTDDRVEKLRNLHRDGLSCSLIASRLGGVTRNAVIGKIHRLGIGYGHKHQPTTRKPHNTWGAEARRRGQRTLKAKLANPAARAGHVAAVREGQRYQREANQAGHDLVIPPGQRKQILDLERGDCKWPYGTGTKADPYYFCCHKAIPGKSYCDFHNARGLQPIQPTRGGNPYVFTAMDALRQPQIPTKSLKEFDAMETA